MSGSVYSCTPVMQLRHSQSATTRLQSRVGTGEMCVSYGEQSHVGTAAVCHLRRTVTRWYSGCVSVTENSHTLVQRLCQLWRTVTRWYSGCVSVTEYSHALVQRQCVSYGEQLRRTVTTLVQRLCVSYGEQSHVGTAAVCQLRRTVTLFFFFSFLTAAV